MWQKYRKTATQEMRPYVPGEDLAGISVSAEDTPELGGMIARNPENHSDQWYVAKEFFAKNYEVEPGSDLTCTLNTLLKAHGNPLPVRLVNLALMDMGYMVAEECNNSDGDLRVVRRLTRWGLRYGRNEPKPYDPPLTRPRYYASKFAELVEHIIVAMEDDDDEYVDWGEED